MTRLFLRFYLGVIAILVVAWLVQGYVLRQRSEAQNVRVVEEALGGGARLAKQRLAGASEAEFSKTLQSIEAEFDYPVQVFRFSDDWLGETERQRLLRDEVVLLGQHIAIAVSHDGPSDADRYGLLMGPLPQFVGPSQTEVTLGFGIVFFLSAIAIAFLLRPVASQLRAVERTADAIANGDLSARIDSDQALKGLAIARAFNSMADRTETSLRSQRELLQAISHELRTPLARIRFAIDLVQSASNDQERNKRLQAIDDASEKLDELVGELLSYVRLDSEAPHLVIEDIDLVLLTNELVEIHSPLYPEVTFQVESVEASILLVADQTSVARAIENLLSNAGRHAKAKVIVRVSRQSQHFQIQVDDDGPGVPEEDRERIFEPFVRLDSTSDRGSGLGLALVQRIAKRQGGQIEITESPLGGARFTLHIPSR